MLVALKWDRGYPSLTGGKHMRTGRGYRQDFSQRRLNRRQALMGTALGGAGLVATTALGCSRKEEQAPTSAARGAKRGGVLTRVAGSEATGAALDAQSSSDQRANRGFRLFAEPLLRYDVETLEVQPEIAFKWEQPSEAEYLLTLRPGVRFHNKPPANGRLLTVEDVLYSLERARTDDPLYLGRSLLKGYRFQAVDSTILKVTAPEPNVTTPMNLASDSIVMVAREVVERATKFNTPEEAVGTGPFIITKAEERVGGEFVRNPEYWDPGLPYLDAVRTNLFADEQAEWAAFLAGKLDIATVPGTQVKSFLARQSRDYQPLWAGSFAEIYAYPNLRRSPFNDPRAVKAVRLLMDHHELITAWAEVWAGRGKHASVLPGRLEVWDLTQEEYERHLEWKQPKDEAIKVALDLLRAAGYSRENPLRFEFIGQIQPGNPSHEPRNLLILDQWRRFGQGLVVPTYTPQEYARIVALRARNNFDYIVGGGMSGATPDPDAYFSSTYYTGGSRNYMGLSDPKLDVLIDQQRRIFDRQRRRTAVKEVLVYLIENGPVTMPVSDMDLNVTQPYVRNYRPEGGSDIFGVQYRWVWLDT